MEGSLGLSIIDWGCERCTFQNKDSAESCEMCGSEKPSWKRGSKPLNDLYSLQLAEAFRRRDFILEFCRQSGEPFIDDSFPPCPKSLFSKPNNVFNIQNFQWLRPKEITCLSEPNVSLTVCRTPLPSDIIQGVLGDCWLLSAIAILTERQELLNGVLLTQECNQEGVYQIRLCKDGFWTTITVDDFFPCNAKRQLVFSKARRNQLWVPLIEKAVAKVHGSYDALKSGTSDEGFSILTGAPCELIFLQPHIYSSESEGPFDINYSWAMMLSSRGAGFVMSASCGARHMNANLPEYLHVGLKPQHSYSILDVKNIFGNRLIFLRNPWGYFSWKGNWSNQSCLWTPEIRKELNYYGQEDGVFWIAFEDFSRYFDSVNVCRIRKDWNDIRVSGTFPPFSHKEYQNCTVLSVLEPTEVDLSLYQADYRVSLFHNKPILDLCIVIFECSDDAELRIKKFVKRCGRQLVGSVGLHVVLEPGYYIVICLAFNHWLTRLTSPVQYPKFVLSFYTSREVFVEELNSSKHLLADTMIQIAIASGEKNHIRENMTAYYLTKQMRGFVLVIENRHPLRWVNIICDCRSSLNVVSTRGDLYSVDSIPPMHRQVINVLTQLEAFSNFSVKHQLKHRPSDSNDLMDWGPKGCSHVPEIDPKLEGLHSPRPI